MIGFILQILALVGITISLMRYFTPYDPIKSIRFDLNLNALKRLIRIKPKEDKDLTMGDVMQGMAPPDPKDQSVYEIPEEDSNHRGLSNIKVVMDTGEAPLTYTEPDPDPEPETKDKRIDISQDTINRLDDFLKNQ